MNSEDEDDNLKPESLPIYRKGKEIFDMVYKIAALIPENNEYLMVVKSQMLCDAALLTVKIAGAEAAGLYDLKMENAAIIRKISRDTHADLCLCPVPCALCPVPFPHLLCLKISYIHNFKNGIFHLPF